MVACDDNRNAGIPQLYSDQPTLAGCLRWSITCPARSCSAPILDMVWLLEEDDLAIHGSP